MPRYWVRFKLRGKVLCSYTVNGTFPGEMEATRELLAYENNVDPLDIRVYMGCKGKETFLK